MYGCRVIPRERVRRGEPAGRRLRERAAAAQPRAAADRRAGAARHQTLRHQQAAQVPAAPPLRNVLSMKHRYLDIYIDTGRV